MIHRNALTFAIDAAEAVRSRFDGLSRHLVEGPGGAAPLAVTMVLPASAAKSRRRRYPAVILLNGQDMLGSAIEMSRALAGTREAAPCILIAAGEVPDGGLDASIARVLNWCGTQPRIDTDRIALFGRGRAGAVALRRSLQPASAIGGCIVADVPAGAVDTAAAAAWSSAGGKGARLAWTENAAPAEMAAAVAWNILPEAVPCALGVPALLHGIRTLWGTGHAYGDELYPLGKPPVEALLRALSPLLGRFWPRPATTTSQAPGPRVIRSPSMARDFEILVSLPASFGESPVRRYPALLALDSNGSFSAVSETAARLAQAGVIEELIVVGIGTPRSEGDVEFGFRRFEEFSPPADGYRFDDELGRFFSSLFALRGQDARRQLGKAPQFHRFIVDELLPLLLSGLPIDESALALLGHSAGGTFVGYAMAQAGSPFRSFLALSPGTAVSGSWMIKAEAVAALGEQARVYLSVGGEENHNRFNTLAGIPATRDYAARLRLRSKGQVEFHCLERETHTTVFVRALAQALASIFPRHGAAQGGVAADQRQQRIRA